MITINSQTMFIKHIGALYVLLVDEYEKEHKVPLWALKSVLPGKSQRVCTKKKSNNKKTINY
jgi:predicted double-glycine peptidase